jgi:hypothetical protein
MSPLVIEVPLGVLNVLFVMIWATTVAPARRAVILIPLSLLVNPLLFKILLPRLGLMNHVSFLGIQPSQSHRILVIFQSRIV